MPKTGIHWFRHGLRLHDNPALLACQDEVERFIPIFIFDGKSAGTLFIYSILSKQVYSNVFYHFLNCIQQTTSHYLTREMNF